MKFRNYLKIKNWKLKITTCFLILITILTTSLFLFRSPGAADAGWWDEDWLYRMKLTIDNTKIDSDLTDFPVLVKLTSSQLTFSKAQGNGQDIRFTDNQGNSLNYEIERWDSGSSLAEVWVKIPVIESTVDTYFYMYYGNASAPPDEHPTEVWDDNYLMVQHMNESEGSAIDSTRNDNDGSFEGDLPDTATAGKIADAQDMDGTGDYVDIPAADAPFLGTITISVWAKIDVGGAYRHFAGKHTDNGANQNPFDFRTTNAATPLMVLVRATNINNYTWTGPAVTLGEWKHYVITAPANIEDQAVFYINGASTNGTGSGSGTGTSTGTSANIRIGDRADSVVTMNGQMDEVRISNIERSAAWVKADYNSGNNTLLTYGSEEQGLGPVLWLKFDEGYGTTTYDSSEQGNDGTMSGATWTTEGKFSRALSFDGSNDYVSLSDIDEMDGASQFTISAWVKAESGGDIWASIVHKYQDTNDNIVMQFNNVVSNRQVYLALENGNNAGATTAVNTITFGVFEHWVMVFDGTKTGNDDRLKFYLNGQAKALTYNGTIASTTDDNSAVVDIGGLDTGNSFLGKIDEVKIYPYARSEAQIKRDYNKGAAVRIGGEYELPSGLVGYWDFDERSGSTAYDRSDNSNDGTLQNNTAWKGSSDCKYGNCLSFDGNGDYVGLSSNASPSSLPMSFSGWINVSDVTVLQALYDSEGGNNYHGIFVLSNVDGTLQVNFGDGGVPGSGNRRTKTSSGTIGANTWHHIAFVVTGATDMNIYIDGIDAGGTYSGTGSTYSAGSVAGTIGLFHSASDDFYFDGQIDHVMIFDRALTQEEISDLYSAGRDMNATVGHWKMDEGQGVTAYDSSGNSNSGTLTNGPTWTTLGKFGKAVDFAGDDDFIDIGDMSANVKSVSLWVKPDAINVTEQPLDLNGTGYVQIVNGTVTGEGFTSPTIYINGISGASTVTTDWNHIVITTGTGIDANDVDIGRLNTTYFNGKIDEVKIYPYVLTSEQVLLDYNNSKALRVGPTSPTIGKWCPPGFTGNCSAPVGEWKMDERTDDTCTGGTKDVCDTSSNSNDGTINGNPVWKGSSDCKYGNCLDFDGDNDYVSIADNASLDFAAGFTWSMWMKPVYTDADARSQKYDAGSGDGYMLWQDDADSGAWKFNVYVNSSEDGIISNAPPTGDWQQVAGVREDDGTLLLYVDGVKQTDTGTMAGAIDSSASLNIGTSFGYGSDFNGLIDEVMIFDRALTQEEISWLYNKGKPVGHWKMDEGQGTTATDSSVNNNAGTVTNATWTASGRFNSALDFDGNGDYVITATDPLFDISGTEPISISAWVKSSITNPGDEVPIAGMIEAIDSGVFDKILVISGEGADAGKFAFHVSDGGVKQAVSNSVNDQKLHHLVGTYDGSNIRLYVDGDLQDTTAATQTYDFTTPQFLIGGRQSTDPYFNGQIDEVKIYNYALTAEQVKIDYNQGAALRFGD